MHKVEIIDGAMGSLFIEKGMNLPEHIWSAHLNLEAREIVYNIHREYIDAGADYITTNTFRTTPRAYKKLGLSKNESELIAEASLSSAISIAKDATKGMVKILGSLAPLEDCYKPELFPGEKDARREYKQLGKWMHQRGVDIFLIETMNNIAETNICIDSIKEYKKPIWVSFVLKDEKHILSGEPLKDVTKMLKEHNINQLLINCNPLERTNKAIEILSNYWDREWGIYPNLGLGEPSPDGVINHIHSDEDFIAIIKKAVSKGATIVGSCCGSNPKHIKLLKNNFT